MLSFDKIVKNLLDQIEFGLEVSVELLSLTWNSNSKVAVVVVELALEGPTHQAS